MQKYRLLFIFTVMFLFSKTTFAAEQQPLPSKGSPQRQFLRERRQELQARRKAASPLHRAIDQVFSPGDLQADLATHAEELAGFIRTGNSEGFTVKLDSLGRFVQKMVIEQVWQMEGSTVFLPNLAIQNGKNYCFFKIISTYKEAGGDVTKLFQTIPDHDEELNGVPFHVALLHGNKELANIILFFYSISGVDIFELLLHGSFSCGSFLYTIFDRVGDEGKPITSIDIEVNLPIARYFIEAFRARGGNILDLISVTDSGNSTIIDVLAQKVGGHLIAGPLLEIFKANGGNILELLSNINEDGSNRPTLIQTFNLAPEEQVRFLNAIFEAIDTDEKRKLVGVKLLRDYRGLSPIPHKTLETLYHWCPDLFPHIRIT
jgi:hypothetical protein